MDYIPFRLLLKSKVGDFVLKGIYSQSPISLLKSRISEKTKIPQSQLRVLHGSPLHLIDLTQTGNSIQSVGIHNGDTLVVQEAVELKELGKTFSEAIDVKEKEDTDVLMELQNNGTLLRKKVPGNNSCLFTSINFVINRTLNLEASEPMRAIVAEIIASDPILYNDAVLGTPNDIYCRWIRQSDSWGGAIECGILAKYYGLEIDVVDIQNGIILRFGEDNNFGFRAFLMYSGSHYDPLYMPTTENGPPVTMFPTNEMDVYYEALNLANELKAAYYKRKNKNISTETT